jgi:hypothetical protein
MKQDEETPQLVLEELNTRILIDRTIKSLFIAVLVFLSPYSSLDYLWPALGIVVLTPTSLFFSLKLRNAKLYFIYYPYVWMFAFLIAFRWWEISPGLSWTLVLTLVPGFTLAAILSVACRDMSEAMYRESVKPNSTLILLGLLICVTGLILSHKL